MVCFGVSVLATQTRVAQACDHCVAQQKATQQASQSRMRHVGGSMGSGRYEGVGFSSSSAAQALRNCCYYGQRPIVEQSVVRGRNGWYACVRYR